jgi:hypothetical protein
MSLSAPETASVGSLFGVPHAPCIATVPVCLATFTAARIRRTIRDGEIVNVMLPAADAYFLMIYLDAVVHADIQADGTSANPRGYDSNTVCLVDLRGGVSIDLHSSLHSVAIVLPKPLLVEVEAMNATGPPQPPSRLVCRRGEADPVIANLAAVLLPLFDRHHASSTSLFRHLATAICAHLLHNFSEREDPLAEDKNNPATNTELDGRAGILQAKHGTEGMDDAG